LDFFKSESNYTGFLSDITNATDYSEWTAMALALEIPTIYATQDQFTTDIEPAMQLAMAAYGCFAMDYSDAVIDCSVSPIEWGDADILIFGSQLTNA